MIASWVCTRVGVRPSAFRLSRHHQVARARGSARGHRGAAARRFGASVKQPAKALSFSEAKKRKGDRRMNITTTFRQMDGTEAVKQYAHTKVAKLQKFLRQSMRADVTLSVEGNEHVAEVHVKSGSTHLRGSERSADMYASIDLVVDKLESQIRTVHSSRISRKRSAAPVRELASGESGGFSRS